MFVDAFPVKLEHCSWPFLDRNEIFLPLRLNKISQHSTLWVSHAGIVKQAYTMNPQTEKSCLEISHRARPCVTRLIFYIGTSQVFYKRCRLGAEKSFPAPCCLSQSRLSLPAASCHAPIAPDCLIGTFQVRGPDKPGHNTQTVIHLFGSRRCSCPPFRCALSQRY